MADDFKKLIVDSKLDVQVYLDVGANLGEYLKGVKELFPACEIHAFEPVRSIFKLLKKNCDSYHNVTLNRTLVSDQNKRFDFIYIDPEIKTRVVGTCTKYEKDPNRSDGDIEKWKKQLTRTINLSYYIKKQHIEKIDLIKIDVEGYEFAVIKGLFEFLKTSAHKPYLYVEVGWGTGHPEWEEKCMPVYEQLFGLGYQRVNFSDKTEDVFFKPVQAD